MHTIDRVGELLDEIAEGLPPVFFDRLNGGVMLLEEAKRHPKGEGDLYILGEYNQRHDLGRYICIYYGSFMRIYESAPEELLREKLRETLLHEFTHHLESLAGERGLEIKDERQLAEYRVRRERGKR